MNNVACIWCFEWNPISRNTSWLSSVVSLCLPAEPGGGYTVEAALGYCCLFYKQLWILRSPLPNLPSGWQLTSWLLSKEFALSELCAWMIMSTRFESRSALSKAPRGCVSTTQWETGALHQKFEWCAGQSVETWGKGSSCNFSVNFYLGLKINDCNIKSGKEERLSLY